MLFVHFRTLSQVAEAHPRLRCAVQICHLSETRLPIRTKNVANPLHCQVQRGGFARQGKAAVEREAAMAMYGCD